MAFGWITKHEYWHVTTQRCAVTISEGLLPRSLEVMSFPLIEYPPTLWSWLSHFVCLWSSFQSQFLPVIFNYYYYYFFKPDGLFGFVLVETNNTLEIPFGRASLSSECFYSSIRNISLSFRNIQCHIQGDQPNFSTRGVVFCIIFKSDLYLRWFGFFVIMKLTFSSWGEIWGSSLL